MDVILFGVLAMIILDEISVGVCRMSLTIGSGELEIRRFADQETATEPVSRQLFLHIPKCNELWRFAAFRDFDARYEKIPLLLIFTCHLIGPFLTVPPHATPKALNSRST